MVQIESFLDQPVDHTNMAFTDSVVQWSLIELVWRSRVKIQLAKGLAHCQRLCFVLNHTSAEHRCLVEVLLILQQRHVDTAVFDLSYDLCNIAFFDLVEQVPDEGLGDSWFLLRDIALAASRLAEALAIAEGLRKARDRRRLLLHLDWASSKHGRLRVKALRLLLRIVH